MTTNLGTTDPLNKQWYLDVLSSSAHLRADGFAPSATVDRQYPRYAYFEYSGGLMATAPIDHCVRIDRHRQVGTVAACDRTFERRNQAQRTPPMTRSTPPTNLAPPALSHAKVNMPAAF
jgi:hypothetical protein